MKIAFVGYGHVGAPLADHLQRLGHTVTLGVNNEASENTKRAQALNPRLLLAPVAEAVRGAEVVFLATPFRANEEAVHGVADLLAGKVLVDCTNPVGPGLTHALGSAKSGAELVQSFAPRAHVVKAFNIYGYENFEDNRFPEYNVKPAMLFCGNDTVSKSIVHKLIAQLGWEPIDVGGLEQAVHLEHMALMMIRLIRVHEVPSFVWAALRR